jgi:hypothetical protein
LAGELGHREGLAELRLAGQPRRLSLRVTWKGGLMGANYKASRPTGLVCSGDREVRRGFFRPQNTDCFF